MRARLFLLILAGLAVLALAVFRLSCPAEKIIAPPFGPEQSATAPLLDLDSACQQMANLLRRQLEPDGPVLVHAPWVLGGDIGREQLDTLYASRLVPLADAMIDQYQMACPSRPITIVVLKDAASYARHAQSLFGLGDVDKSGFYWPTLRTIAVNYQAAEESLGHELTHALMNDDFPSAPPWLAEGMASLHEAVQIEEGRPRLRGLVNWRLPRLVEAARAGQMPSLESLLLGQGISGSGRALRYAEARFWCLYLQQRGVLATFYREFRIQPPGEASGKAMLQKLLGDRPWTEIDADFTRFVIQLDDQSKPH